MRRSRGTARIVCGRVRCRYERLVLGANQRARSAEPWVFRHGWVYTTPEPVAGGGSPGCTRLPGAMPEPAAGSGAQGRTGPTDAMPDHFEPRLRLHLGVEEGDVEDLRECTLHTYLDWGLAVRLLSRWAVRLLSRCLRWACLLCSWLIVTVGIIVAVQRWAGRDIDVQVHFEVASREAWASIAGVWRSTARAVRRDLEVSTRTA